MTDPTLRIAIDRLSNVFSRVFCMPHRGEGASADTANDGVVRLFFTLALRGLNITKILSAGQESFEKFGINMK